MKNLLYQEYVQDKRNKDGKKESKIQTIGFANEYGKIERRINRGKPFLDLDLLRIIDENIWEKVTRAQIVLDEYELEKLIKSDENVLETVQNAIKTTKPKTALYFSNIKETDKT